MCWWWCHCFLVVDVVMLAHLWGFEYFFLDPPARGDQWLRSDPSLSDPVIERFPNIRDTSAPLTTKITRIKVQTDLRRHHHHHRRVWDKH